MYPAIPTCRDQSRGDRVAGNAPLRSCVGGGDVEDRTDRSQNREAKGVVGGPGESKRVNEQARLL